jgi:hypothetical protein
LTQQIQLSVNNLAAVVAAEQLHAETATANQALVTGSETVPDWFPGQRNGPGERFAGNAIGG